ncbi:hypothetical protein F8388_018725 [Cannabis sativa]|uniref:Polygalacturonase n=1 Tax=Cannabis sativa TaxID=3483 RepID=A0A7J6FD41_CANSA|nr:hypothetical protein F8388_018725 [Cannabis sativa]
MLILSAPPTLSTSSFNVLMGFGAKPNGLTDSTNAFLRAWEAACTSTHAALIYVPKGRYLLRPLAFKGPCKSPHITFRIDGTLVAPHDYRVLGGAENWLNFQRVSGVSIVGGALDAKGHALWACKAQSNQFEHYVLLRHKNYGLLSLNSQMFHIVINHCENVADERSENHCPLVTVPTMMASTFNSPKMLPS